MIVGHIKKKGEPQEGEAMEENGGAGRHYYNRGGESTGGTMKM